MNGWYEAWNRFSELSSHMMILQKINLCHWNQVKYKPQYQTSNRSIKNYYNTRISQHKKSSRAWELKYIPVHKENIIPKKENVPVSSVNTCSGDHRLFGSNSTRPLKKSTNARQSAFSVSEQNRKKWIYHCTSKRIMIAMIFFFLEQMGIVFFIQEICTCHSNELTASIIKDKNDS
jgi:hypothetical protein